MVFRGRIDREAAREFLRLSEDPAVLRLVIRSQGGLVDAALDMAEAVHDRGLDVEVDGFVCWFGKIAPYAEPEFYDLSPADMARFGIRDVAVRDPAQAPSAEVRMLAVDSAVLERDRPVVRLQE